MGTRNRLSVARPCCDEDYPPPGTCLISAGWECDEKNGIDSADVTGWSVDSGTWNATQDWESGSTADALETTSSNARISCDTQQSQPLNDKLRVYYWVKVTNSADEAVILLAGIKVIIKSGSVSISSGGSTIASANCGIQLNTIAAVKVCTWTDSGTSSDYIGVDFGYHQLVGEVSLGTDGTTEFGSDSVTGTVSFHHDESFARRCGDFYHNTTRTDGSGQECGGCKWSECVHCPGGDAPRYLTVSIEGLQNGYGNLANGWCTNCEDWDGSYVFDLSCLHFPCGYAISPAIDWSDVCSAELLGIPGYYGYFYFGIATAIVADGSGWKLRVFLTEMLLTSSVPLSGWPSQWGTVVLHYATRDVEYAKTYSASDKCTAIDDELSYIATSREKSPFGCSNWDGLTVHVTASD